jgi:hypothetical protein
MDTRKTGCRLPEKLRGRATFSVARQISVLLVFLSVVATVGCGSATDATPKESPPRPTPSSPNPLYLAFTAKDALTLTLPEITGRGGGQFSGRILSVSSVETTVAQLSGVLDPALFRTYPPATRAWLFVAYGSFQQHGQGQTGPAMSTAISVVVAGYPAPAWSELENRRYDLTQIGTEVVIRPGDVPEIDQVRGTGDPTP